MARTSKSDLDEMARHISNITGVTHHIGWAYGAPRLMQDGNDISPRLQSGQLLTWMHAFVSGIGQGRVAHKHDLLRTTKLRILEVDMINGTPCGDCGRELTTRYESGWEIGIAPFRWLCSSCFQNLVDAGRMTEKLQDFAQSTPFNAQTVTAPNGVQFPACQHPECNMLATHAVGLSKDGVPWMQGQDDPQKCMLCVWHAKVREDWPDALVATLTASH